MPNTITPTFEHDRDLRPRAAPNAVTRAAMEDADSGKLPQFESIQELFDDLEKNSAD